MNFDGFLCKTHIFDYFSEFPKSRIPIRNRRLSTLLVSKFNKKYQIGKLRLSAFQRLKNQRLRTSPSKVMALSKSDKKSIKFMKNNKIRKILGFYLRRLKKRFFNLFGVHELPKNATMGGGGVAY